MTQDLPAERRLFIISAPSGAGKTTLVKRVLSRRDDLRLCVSHTTRAPRPGEENGVAYHFVDQETFHRLVDENAFLEWAEVHGNHYGTSRAEVERSFEQGLHALCDVDVQGATAIREKIPQAIALFVVPPTMGELAARLRGRGTESDEAIRRRLANAQGELVHATHYDYVLVNDDLDRATDDLMALLHAAPLATRFQSQLVRRLLAEKPGTQLT